MFKLPKLNYDYAALEPYIDARTMEIHHSKHHQGYVDKLNQAVKAGGLKGDNLEGWLRDLSRVPEKVRQGVRKAGGGHYNHSLFWEIMIKGGSEPEGELRTAIEKEFSGLEKLKEELSVGALGVFGSGWVWLSLEEKKLKVEATANQDNPLMEGRKPILGLDVWEHAYYLKYQNRRAEYVENWWQVVNWQKAGEKYSQAVK
jgi:Fe-Mn family superoxide dismutase